MTVGQIKAFFEHSCKDTDDVFVVNPDDNPLTDSYGIDDLFKIDNSPDSSNDSISGVYIKAM